MFNYTMYVYYKFTIPYSWKFLYLVLRVAGEASLQLYSNNFGVSNFLLLFKSFITKALEYKAILKFNK